MAQGGSKNVGKDVPRKEGRSKVTGRSKYVDDITLPNMIHGATVRSSVPRGKIKAIHFDKSIPWDEFTVVTADDISGENYVATPGKNSTTTPCGSSISLIENDQPFLVKDVINHPDEPVVLIAHPDKHILQKAVAAVRIETESLPAVLSIEDSLKCDPVIWRKDNVLKSFLVEKGDVDSVWDTADHIIEGEYCTGAQEQLYIENNGVIAAFDEKEGVTVWGSMQCPYYVHNALMPLFNFPPEKVRVIQMETGGGFGGKEEYPSMLSGHAALLAMKSGRPVKMIYSRAEDMKATTKRHPSRSIIKAAVSKEGKLLGIDFDFVIDGGAYATLSSVVLSRGTIHAAGPYVWDNVRVRSRAVATNVPPHGAFRGFGAPQSIFAIERHLDKIAKVVGISPEELRRRNFLKPGEKTATDQLIEERVDFDSVLNRALKESNYLEKRKQFEEHNKTSPIKKGIGVATFMHGAGFTGSGEKSLASIIGLEATPEGKFQVLVSSTEIGQGTNTILSQIASDELGVSYEDVSVAQPDTNQVPNSGPTVASRTCMIVGKLVETAAQSMRTILQEADLIGESYTSEEFVQACRQYIEQFGKLKVFSKYKQPGKVVWDDEKYRGDAYATYAWAAYVAEVSVDTNTFETTVDDFVAVQEVGKVIHPVLAKGQIEGGVAQAIGYAVYEKAKWEEGSLINNQMTNYIMPTAADLPPIRVFFEETNQKYGPSGAKGIGELPMDGPGPAIISAVENATGVAHNAIPMLSEDLMEAMHG